MSSKIFNQETDRVTKYSHVKHINVKVHHWKNSFLHPILTTAMQLKNALDISQEFSTDECAKIR
jgi:hypothetical protein